MLTNKQKKDWAYLLYSQTDMTKVEIASKVEVQRNTLTKWIEEGKWEVVKGSIIITKEKELRRLYYQLNDLNNTIEGREEGKRHATSAEGDIISKYSAAIKNLETELNIAVVVDVCIAINNWLSELDFAKAQEWADIQDAFIKDRLRKY